MHESVLIVLGAAAGYGFGWLKEMQTRRRERRAAATALQAELVRLDGELGYLSARWRGGRAVLELATPMFDEVPRLVTHFKPLTVARLLDFVGHVAELRRMLTFFAGVPDGPQRVRLIAEIKDFAGNVAAKGHLVSHSLGGAGAVVLAQAPLHEEFGLPGSKE